MTSLKIKTLLAAGILAGSPLFADNGPTIITTSVTESDVSYTATGASTALTVTGSEADYTGTNITISSASSGFALWVSDMAEVDLTNATISGLTKIDAGGALSLSGGSLGGVSIWGATSTFAYSGGTTFNAGGFGIFSAYSGASLDLTGATFTNTSVGQLNAIGSGSVVSGTGLTVTQATANDGVVNLSGGSVNSINLSGVGSAVNLSGGATANNAGGGSFSVGGGATLNLDTLPLASTSVRQLNVNDSGSVVSGTGLTVSQANAYDGGVVNLSGGSVDSISLKGVGSAVNLSGGATVNNGGGGAFTAYSGATLDLNSLPLASTSVSQLNANGSGSVVSGTGLTVSHAVATAGGVVNLSGGSVQSITVDGATASISLSDGAKINATDGYIAANNGATLDLNEATFTDAKALSIAATDPGSSISVTGLTITYVFAIDGGVVNLNGGSVGAIHLVGNTSVLNLSGGVKIGGSGSSFAVTDTTLNVNTLPLIDNIVGQLYANGSFASISGTNLTLDEANADNGGTVNLFGGTVKSIVLTGASSSINLSGGVQVNSGGGGSFYAQDGAILNVNSLPLANTSVNALYASGIGSKTLGSSLTVYSAYAYNGGEINLTGGSVDSAFVHDNGTLLLGSGTIANNIVVQTGGLIKGTGNAGNLVLNAGGSVAPGNSPGILNANNVTWGGGAIYEWELNNTVGIAGVAFDQLVATGTLDVQAVSANKFLIKILGLDATNAAGAVQNWDGLTDQSWIIASAEGGVVNFDADAFTIDASGFTNNNDTAGYAFTVEQSGDGKAIVLKYTVAAVPEPSTYGLLGAGALAAVAFVRRRRRKLVQIA